MAPGGALEWPGETGTKETTGGYLSWLLPRALAPQSGWQLHLDWGAMSLDNSGLVRVAASPSPPPRSALALLHSTRACVDCVGWRATGAAGGEPLRAAPRGLPGPPALCGAPPLSLRLASCLPKDLEVMALPPFFTSLTMEPAEAKGVKKHSQTHHTLRFHHAANFDIYVLFDFGNSSAEYSYNCVPAVEHWLDPRNLQTLGAYVVLVVLVVYGLARPQQRKGLLEVRLPRIATMQRMLFVLTHNWRIGFVLRVCLSYNFWVKRIGASDASAECCL